VETDVRSHAQFLYVPSAFAFILRKESLLNAAVEYFYAFKPYLQLNPSDTLLPGPTLSYVAPEKKN
jgi:hypothetical protein